MEEVVERASAFGGELFRSAIGDDDATIDDDGAGAGSGDFFKNVGREEDGFFLPEILDELADFKFLVGVEAVGRFVEDEDFGIVEKGLGEAGAVAISLGKGADGLAGHVVEEAGLDR